MLNEIKVIFPELILILGTMIVQLYAVFNQKSKLISKFFIIICLLGIYSLLKTPLDQSVFNHNFILTLNEQIIKIILLIFIIITIFIYENYCLIYNQPLKSEFISLLLLSTLGLFILLSCRNFLLWFCGLELQALTSYALTAFNVNDSKSSEAALKYFILGALLSCITGFGISYIYGFGGSIDFSNIHLALMNGPNVGLIIGIILAVSGVLFKLSASPFHFWTPDVYEGAPVSTLVYFSSATKFGFLLILINFLNIIVGEYTQISVTLIKIVAILSMTIGCLGAIIQNSLKRLMAYSSILNTGYCLIAVATREGFDAAMINMLIYTISAMGLFICLLGLVGQKIENVTFNDLKGLSTKHPILSGAVTIIMLSMIGLPPFAGFFGKYNIFYEAVKKDELLLAVSGVVTSIIAAFYYLKIIKTLYFDNINLDNDAVLLSKSLLLIILTITIFLTAYVVFPLNNLIQL